MAFIKVMYENVRIFRLCMLQDLGLHRGFPGVASGKEPAKNFADTGDVRDAGSILGLGRSPGGRHGNPLQYSCLENPIDRGAWQATVHRVALSRR